MARPPEATEGAQGTEWADSALSPSSPLCSMSWAIGAALGRVPLPPPAHRAVTGRGLQEKWHAGVRGKAWRSLALQKLLEPPERGGVSSFPLLWAGWGGA